ncbi:Integrator complex subunit 9 [Phytophthora pseudosyringae]|uniref:Integrator complex subunit 9 n=1 Tax=Phytophthora pseudosyringae TaxID=221518 RepID=A0A8T1VJZ3_9STRA|nr:Integrator complex subunit 9 [Phytophthora pseudosyringae]
MERVEDGSSMNVVPSMFHAGISNKFTKRHVGNFRDTTLTAASAAKQRAERKLERQADAIEKQQQKIDDEMKKIAEITQNLHRQQLREAKRLRNRLNYAASKIQAAVRRHLVHVHQLKRDAAAIIQMVSRGFLARRLCCRLNLEREEYQQNCSSMTISRCIRRFTGRNIRAREIELRYTAAYTIQSMVRMAAARSYVQVQRRQREEAELQYRAAIVIQCNARSFMTRLIYLDVLYLVCRIQAAMRGCLVRRQLRWLRVSDVDAISKLQAHVRGFLVRRRLECEQDYVDRDGVRSSLPSSRSCQGSVQETRQGTQADFGASGRKLEVRDRVDGGHRTARASSFSFVREEKVGKNGISSLVRSSTGLGWQPTVEPAIKRSYWLPAGASFDKRLPVLPVPKRMMAIERVTADNGDPLGDELRPINQSWTPKKRPHQKPCPVRLSPVVIPPVRNEGGDPSSSELKVEEEDTSRLEERLRRQEELKQKLQLRRNQEKRQQDYELNLKREAENEANERKLMEREEKAVRLQLKILRRRSKEGKIRQVTVDQRREERERLAMAREERHVRLHIKFRARQRDKKRQQLTTASTTTSESESQPPSTSSSRHEGHNRWKSSATKTRRTKSGSKKVGDVSSDDDGDMSFLDINFTIPSSMKQPGINTRSSQSKNTRLSSSTHGPSKKRPAGGKSRRKIPLSSTPGRGESPLPVETAAEEDDCGYGDEFDDVVDEAALSHLIC